MSAIATGSAGVASVRRYGWRAALAAFACAITVLLVAYWDTARSLVHIWASDGTYQYAFLIFPLSLWIAFTLRDRVRSSTPKPSAAGVVLVAALVFIWYAGHMLSINLPQHFAFVALFPALVLACWGWRALWTLQFPLVYLVVFAVPWGDSMVGPLQDITAHMAVGVLNLTGMPVLMNGREIVTPSAVWMVEAACSGVKFFIACTALGSLFAYLMYSRARKRVAFVLLAAIAPIIANGLRVYFTILIGETFGLHYATGTDHLIFGWQFFGTVLVVLMVIGWLFRDAYVKPAKAAPAVPLRAGARLAAWPAVIALLVAGPVLAASLAIQSPPARLAVTAPAVAGWQGPLAAAGDWRPRFAGAAGEFRSAYRSSGSGNLVEVFHAVYSGAPREGHNLVTYGNDLYDHAAARELYSSARDIRLAGGSAVRARELRLAGTDDARLVWYWYCVNRHCGASPVLAKVWQAWEVLRGAPLQSSVWALSTPVERGDDAHARSELAALARVLPVAADPRGAAARAEASR